MRVIFQFTFFKKNIITLVLLKGVGRTHKKKRLADNFFFHDFLQNRSRQHLQTKLYPRCYTLSFLTLVNILRRSRLSVNDLQLFFQIANQSGPVSGGQGISRRAREDNAAEIFTQRRGQQPFSTPPIYYFSTRLTFFDGRIGKL